MIFRQLILQDLNPKSLDSIYPGSFYCKKLNLHFTWILYSKNKFPFPLLIHSYTNFIFFPIANIWNPCLDHIYSGSFMCKNLDLYIVIMIHKKQEWKYHCVWHEIEIQSCTNQSTRIYEVSTLRL
jgi:hypothetical protein